MLTEFEIMDEKWEIDTANLVFSDATLNQFFEKISGIIDYVGAGHAKAMLWAAKLDHAYKQTFILQFKNYKALGKSDKVAELSAEGEQGVSDIKEAYLNAKYVKDRLYAHLQALNSAREDAHNRGHMIRKELDKLNLEVRIPSSEGM